MDLFKLNINFDLGTSIFNLWEIDLDITKNYIQIENQDYFLRYVNPDVESKRKNKGGNSIIYFIYNAQNYDEDYSIPEKVIKISRFYNNKINDKVFQSKINLRFQDEVIALDICKKKNFPNIISIENSGYLTNRYMNGKVYPFYIMEYAKYDLKNLIDKQELKLEQKILFCYEIACGLNQLERVGIYHRDLKPDNIFFVDDKWKIGDLGLIEFRDEENTEDTKSIIGPKGWLSPEAMNKYITNNLEREHFFDCKIDHQSDIFQLGKVFWYIIQGNAPIGCIKPYDFLEKKFEIYTLLRTMLNHSKKKRYKHIDEVITILRRINEKILKQ